MTWLERYSKEHPGVSKAALDNIVHDACPSDVFDDDYLIDLCDRCDGDCRQCWNQQIPEKKEEIDIEAINVEFEEDDIMPPIMPPEEEKKEEIDIEAIEVEPKIPSGASHIQKMLYDNITADSLNEKLKEVSDKFNKAFGKILDSGARREFGTGAVRDIQEGKGRCDLLPIDVVGIIMHDPVFTYIDLFQDTGDEKHLYDVIDRVVYAKLFPDHKTLFLEVAKHFEEGCKKYGESNWRKGIPAHCYIDSAVRHYLKHLRGDKDEPHDKAFVWNILCCIWTCLNKPELNDYYKEEK